MNQRANIINQYPTRLLAVLMAVLAFELPAHAQTPLTDGSSPVGLPDAIEPTEDPRAAEQIGKALQGDSSSPLPGGTLGDVIDIIRKQGSVLDGSSLDPRVVQPALAPQASADFPSVQKSLSRVKTAEALLRSARMLESLSTQQLKQPEAHPDLIPASQLVRQMRIQATRLLIIEFPQSVE